MPDWVVYEVRPAGHVLTLFGLYLSRAQLEEAMGRPPDEDRVDWVAWGAVTAAEVARCLAAHDGAVDVDRAQLAEAERLREGFWSIGADPESA